MLLKYIDAAMKRARYEKLPESEGYFGEIPGIEGVWASADTLDGCREELQSALEDWIIFSLDAHLPTPILDGLKPKASPGPAQEVA